MVVHRLLCRDPNHKSLAKVLNIYRVQYLVIIEYTGLITRKRCQSLQEHGLASEVKDTKDDEGPPWQLVKNKKNKKMNINQNTHVKQVNGPNITKRHGDNLQKIIKCGMRTCG